MLPSKIKNVHSIEWLGICTMIETVFYTMYSLIYSEVLYWLHMLDILFVRIRYYIK